MQRRSFLTQLMAAGAAPSPRASSRLPRILAWAHADKDFAGSDDDLRRALDQAREAGIGALLPFVHSHPEESQAWYASTLSGFAVKDVLSRAVELARAAGVEIHPILGGVVDFGLNPTTRQGRSYVSGKPGGSPQDGRFCASHAATRTGSPRIAADILDHHAVQGLHLDYIRYVDTGNGLKWPCRCQACRLKYREIFGRADITAADLQAPGAVYKYLQFRNANITEVIRQVRAVGLEHGVELSMAGRADYFGAALVEGQDWADWARRGWLNFLCPMNYTTDRAEHRRWLKGQLDLVGAACRVYSGIGRKWSAGELASAEMLRQAEDALSLGAAGVCVFHFNALSAADFRALKELR